MIRILSWLLLASSLASPQAYAEFLGFVHGRSAFPGNNAQMSVEASALAGSSYSRFGARMNYRSNETLTVYFDIDGGEIGDDFTVNGIGFGAGVYLYVPRQPLTDVFDLAVRGSVHLASLESDTLPVLGSIELDYRTLAADVLISGVESLTAGGLGWFASAGLSVLSVDLADGGSDDEQDLLLSGGLYLPLGSGDLFAGVEYLDGTAIGIGYRHGLR